MTDALLLISLAGLGAGAAHVYLGVDHLAALLPIAHGRRADGFWLGLRWGIGHSLGVVFVAVCFLALREFVGLASHFELAGIWGERIVGVFLIGLGVLGIRAAASQHVHSHSHQHENTRHHHLHVHESNEGHAVDQPSDHQDHALHGHASFAAGVLHGIAGMSHLWVVLPSLALPAGDAGMYLASFAIGAMLSMALFGAGVGYATAAFETRLPSAITQARYATSGVCVAIGAGWLTYSFL